MGNLFSWGANAQPMRRSGMKFPAYILIAALLALCACDSQQPMPDYDKQAAWKTLGLEASQEAFDESLRSLNDVVLDPPPEWGKDYNPTFPPDIPFNPDEWLTNDPGPSVAVPDAPKGGVLRLSISSYPPTIRTEGPNSRLATLSTIHGLIYESLMGYDHTIGDYVPGLASHWQVEADRQTYRFRINPKARWADGRPVTADDVAATFEHYMNPDRKDPSVSQYYDELIDQVKILDRLTVEVRSKEPRWQSLLTISGSNIYPAAYIRMDGETYVNEWNWKLPPGTGPYELKSEDIKKGQSITVRRRKDYWDEDNPNFQGAFNFGAIRWEVIRDAELTYQKFLAGELDLYWVSRAQRWVDELDRENAIRMGWVQKRKIYNQSPNGFGGYCFNMREPPFDSLNVRKAFAHLFNREKLFEKFFFFQYEYIDSYYPGQPWARPNAERVRYDPGEARRLLALDGWTDRDDEGYLVNAKGERFPVIPLEFASPSFQRIHAVVVDDLWQQAGIKMEMDLIDYPSLLKKVWEYKYKITYWGWTASLFPEPIQNWHSKYADQPQTNNLNGFKNEEADKIMEAYQTEFDGKKRIMMLQRLDELLFEAHPYALGWYAPYFRVVYWDKFGHPPEYASRFARDTNNIITYWWYDEVRDRRTQANKATNTASYPDKPLNQYDAPEQTWWNEHDLPMSEVN
jgi:microcin C transport system substrate-binding protein